MVDRHPDPISLAFKPLCERVLAESGGSPQLLPERLRRELWAEEVLAGGSFGACGQRERTKDYLMSDFYWGRDCA